MRRRGVFRSAAAALVLWPAALGSPSSLENRALLDGVACRERVEEQLAVWGAAGRWQRQADGPMGERIYRTPTTRIGVWVSLSLGADGSASAFLVDAAASRRVSWDGECREHRADGASPLPPTGGAGFTDAHLKRALTDHRAGVLYLWSPHMPYSIQGYTEVAALASRLGVALVAFVDPMSEREYAISTARRAGIPPEAMAPLQSLELVFRDLTLHAPSLQLFANGKLVGPMLPGYREPKKYEAFFRRYLRHLLGER